MLVGLAVCAIVIQSWWAAIVGGLFGLAAVTFIFGRRGDRWWTEIFALRLRFRGRRGIVTARCDGPRLAALAPDFTAEDVAGADDSKPDVGSDGAGWFAALEVVAEDGPLPPVPMAALARIATEQPGVVHSAPLPGTARRDLRRGLRARGLDTDGLPDALVRSCELAEPADRQPVQPREEWDSWRSTRLRPSTRRSHRLPQRRNPCRASKSR